MWELCVYRSNGVYAAITAAVLTAIKILFQNIPNLNFFSPVVPVICLHVLGAGSDLMQTPACRRYKYNVGTIWPICLLAVCLVCLSGWLHMCIKVQSSTKENGCSDTTVERTVDINLPQNLNWQVTTVDTPQVFLPSERSALTRFYKPLSLGFDSVDIQNGCWEIWTLRTPSKSSISLSYLTCALQSFSWASATSAGI